MIQLCPLTDVALLGIAGPDAAKFLQGQVTCDINQITPNSSRLGAHCTPKGRMVSNFLAARLDSGQIVLRLHKDVLPALQQSLGKYIVFSKAKLANHTSDYLVIGLLGNTAIATLNHYFGLSLHESGNTETNANGTFICLSNNRVECWLTTAQLESLRNKLGDQHCLATQDDWLLASISAGYGDVYPQTQGEWIPQMLNYQVPEVNGISFSKGCYTGQEIVARMQYLGKLKRHMYRFQTPTQPEPGALLYSRDHNQSIGEVVMAGQSGDRIECLACVTSEAVNTDNVYLDAATTLKLLNLPLPYPLSTAINT